MKKINLQVSLDEFGDVSELTTSEQDLMQRATEASAKAYAPYSGFFVGAAVLLDDGQIVCGNNQENVAYPSGLCAERTALFAASANFPGAKVKMIAITAKNPAKPLTTPVYPCGACRQVIAEYERLAGAPIRILMKGEEGKVHVVDGLSNLLPFSFEPDNLK